MTMNPILSIWLSLKLMNYLQIEKSKNNFLLLQAIGFIPQPTKMPIMWCDGVVQNSTGAQAMTTSGYQLWVTNLPDKSFIIISLLF